MNRNLQNADTIVLFSLDLQILPCYSIGYLSNLSIDPKTSFARRMVLA